MTDTNDVLAADTQASSDPAALTSPPEQTDTAAADQKLDQTQPDTLPAGEEGQNSSDQPPADPYLALPEEDRQNIEWMYNALELALEWQRETGHSPMEVIGLLKDGKVEEFLTTASGIDPQAITSLESHFQQKFVTTIAPQVQDYFRTQTTAAEVRGKEAGIAEFFQRLNEYSPELFQEVYQASQEIIKAIPPQSTINQPVRANGQPKDWTQQPEVQNLLTEVQTYRREKVLSTVETAMENEIGPVFSAAVKGAGIRDRELISHLEQDFRSDLASAFKRDPRDARIRQSLEAGDLAGAQRHLSLMIREHGPKLFEARLKHYGVRATQNNAAPPAKKTVQSAVRSSVGSNPQSQPTQSQKAAAGSVDPFAGFEQRMGRALNAALQESRQERPRL